MLITVSIPILYAMYSYYEYMLNIHIGISCKHAFPLCLHPAADICLYG